MIVFDQTNTGASSISQKELYDLWIKLAVVESFNNYTYSDFENTFQVCIQKNTNQFLFNPKSWEIKLSEGLVKTSLMAVILTFLLKSYGESNIPLNILILIIPLLFDIKKITLDDKEKKIYLDLTKSQFAYVHAHNPSNLYDNYLSDEIKNSLNKLDFQNFLGKLEQMGLVKHISSEKVIIKSIGRTHIHFTFG